MKKAGKILLYISLMVAAMLLIYHHAAYEIMQSLASSKEGLLLSVFHRISNYFKDADSLNLIFLVVFMCVSLVGFVIIDSMLPKVYHFAAGRVRRMKEISVPRWITSPLQRVVSLLLLGIFFILLCNAIIILYGTTHSTDSTDQVQAGPVLILGTRKRLSSGKGENLYYRYRIESALALWRSHKATYFIASGDRAGDHYDETRDIRNDLIAEGVPADKVRLDTAGYRTLDSMLRIRQIYGTKEVVIVTQAFHAQRALFLAKFYGMDGIGFYAKGSATTGMMVREFFSKPKVVMDLILFNMQPKVQANEGKNPVQFREEFKVTSDLHVVFLLVLGIAVVSSLGLAYKYLD